MVTDLVVPEGITGIHDYALAGCTGLKRIVLPTSIASLGKESMAGCHSLSQIKNICKTTSKGG